MPYIWVVIGVEEKDPTMVEAEEKDVGRTS
jgi:hypothetical protein